MIKEYVLSMDEIKKKFPIGSQQIINNKKYIVEGYEKPQTTTNMASYSRVIFKEENN